jgi:uncharacterized protein (DUF1501 family)
MLLIGENKTRTCQGITRRGLVQAGILGALGLNLPDFLAMRAAAAQPGRQRAVILLWLWGGPSHLDTFDPKPEAPSEYRGPYRAITTRADGIQVTELFPELAKRANLFSLVRSLNHGTNDHGLAGAVNLTGRMPQAGRISPNTGSIVARIRSSASALSHFVAIGEPMQQGHRLIQGEGGGILGSVYDPLRVRYDMETGVLVGETKRAEGITEERLARRRGLMAALDERGRRFAAGRETRALDHFYQQAFSLMSSGEASRALELRLEPDRLRDRYSRTRFGQSCLLARRLVESGVPFVQVNWSTHVEAEEDAGDGGWDNHYRNFELMQERQAWPLDRALSALLDDLRDRGMLEETLVVAVGEFGRTPKINDKAGRDHWQTCYTALLAGGGVQGGLVVGSSDARGEYPASNPKTPADLQATVLDRLGITRTDVLNLGLPVDGEVIAELL